MTAILMTLLALSGICLLFLWAAVKYDSVLVDENYNVVEEETE